MHLTVVIPSHNRCELLRRVLEGLCHQTYPELLGEVIVVGDGCTDSTGHMVSTFATRLPVRFADRQRGGVSSARNYGLSLTSSPIVLFLDDDVIPDARLIAEHASFHDSINQLEAVLLGYVTWHPEVNVTSFMRWYGEYGGLFGFSRLRDGDAADPKFLYTCNVSFRTDFLRSHGAFDERLTVLEDHELGYRLAQHGMNLVFRKAAIGYHYQTFTFEQACERLRKYRAGLAAFLSTEAGGKMSRERSRPVFRLADSIVGALGPILEPIRFLPDSKRRLPNPIYRLFYWHFATLRSFWRPETTHETSKRL